MRAWIVLCLPLIGPCSQAWAQSCQVNGAPPARGASFVFSDVSATNQTLFEAFKRTEHSSFYGSADRRTIGVLALTASGDALAVPFSNVELEPADFVSRLNEYQRIYDLDRDEPAKLTPLSGLFSEAEPSPSPFSPRPGSVSVDDDLTLIDPELINPGRGGFDPGTPPQEVELPDLTSQVIGDVDTEPAVQAADLPSAEDPHADLANLQSETERQNRRALQAADSVVLITQKVAGNKIQYCNGVHVGDGQILTNQHCIGSGDFQVWFGDIKWDKQASQPRSSDLACNADADLSYKPLAPGSPDAKRLDAAIIKVPASDIAQYPRFANSFATVQAGDPWCRSAAACGPSAEPGSPLTLIQVWSGSTSASDPSVPADGTKTISAPDAASESGDENPCHAQDTQLSEKKFSNRVISVCRSPISDISSFGAPHTCDTTEGGSGAPVFDRAAYNAFINGQTSTLVLSGLHRSGKRRVGNCLIPATLLSVGGRP